MKTLATRMQRAALAIVLALSFLAALPTHAQDTDWSGVAPAVSPPTWSYGLRAGLAQTNFYGEATSSVEPGVGFTAGGFLTYRLSPGWALQPEILYTRWRGDVEQHNQIFSNARDAKYTFSFIETPLLVKAYLPERQGSQLYLAFGPHARMRLSGDAEDINHVLNDVDIDDEFRTWDYGFTAGVGAESYAGRRSLLFDARYSWGLANLFADSDRPDFRTRGFTFSIGMRL